MHVFMHRYLILRSIKYLWFMYTCRKMHVHIYIYMYNTSEKKKKIRNAMENQERNTMENQERRYPKKMKNNTNLQFHGPRNI